MAPPKNDVIAVREAEFADYNSIARLHARSWQQHYRGILSDHFLNHLVEEDRSRLWHNRLASPAPDQWIVTAMLHNSLVGFACMYLDSDSVHGSLLDNLHVSLQMQSSGIGRRLMGECAQKVLSDCNIPSLFLWVFEANTKAREFYDKAGGIHLESTLKEHEDGTKAVVYRYVWSADALKRLTVKATL